VLNHDGVQIVVNLTIPAAHAEVSSAILAAGKHVWTEKPLTVDRASGKAVLEQAAAAGLRVGSAPDILHPNPQFLLARGGGPLLDMGPYYLTTLVHVFGAVDAVAAIGSKSRTSGSCRPVPTRGRRSPSRCPPT